MEHQKFTVVFLEEAEEFILSLPQQVQKKIIYNIRKIKSGVIDVELFKKLEGTSIWEFRTLFNKIQYRLFAFWDTEKEALVIATHGIIKKVPKTPHKEIEKAERLRYNYFMQKNKRL